MALSTALLEMAAEHVVTSRRWSSSGAGAWRRGRRKRRGARPRERRDDPVVLTRRGVGVDAGHGSVGPSRVR